MEFINEWNHIIPFHLEESDLLHPNEEMVTKALTSYLKMLNFDVNIIQNNVNFLVLNNICVRK